MVFYFEKILRPTTFDEVKTRLETAPFSEGQKTAGEIARSVKRNLQLEDSQESRGLTDLVAHQVFARQEIGSAILCSKSTRPLVNRYEQGMFYGPHTDNVMMGKGQGLLRSDLAGTLFLSAPQDYEGGELVIHQTDQSTRIKLEANTLVIYPAQFLHEVTLVTQGRRDAAVFWFQSFVRSPAQREALYRQEQALSLLSEPTIDREKIRGLLHHVQQNLLHQWMEMG